jgi:hypothetical protein
VSTGASHRAWCKAGDDVKTRYDGKLYVDHDVEDPALCDRDEEEPDPRRMSDWPIGDLVMHALAGRKVYEFENFERAMLDTLALELHALRAAIELGEINSDQNPYSETFTEDNVVHMLNVLARRAQVGVIVAQRLTDARREPPPKPKPFVPGPFKHTPDVTEATP